MEKYLKSPLYAGLFGAAVTAATIYFMKGMHEDQKKPLPNSAYTKPALFVFALVYFIVYYGNGQYETISKDPF